MNNSIRSSEQHPSRFKLDSYIMASCSAEDSQIIESHCQTCDECKEYLNALTDSSATITSKFPDFGSLHNVVSKNDVIKEQTPKKLLKFHAVLSPAIAALFVFALVIPMYIMMTNHKSDSLHVKGSPQWLLFAESQFVKNTVHEINVHAFDTVQLFLLAAKPLYFTVMYQDDDGPLNKYNGTQEVLRNLSDGKPVPLPFSIVLDSLWNREDIYCVASENKLSAEAITAVIRDYGKLNDTTTGIWIRKFTLHRK
jgi:hypothetical protein